MDDSRAKKASEILARFFDEATIEAANQYARVRTTWKQIVGERLADHSQPKSIVRQTLLIAADHAGWIQLLQLNREKILSRIAKLYPELTISNLAFTIEEIPKDAALLNTAAPGKEAAQVEKLEKGIEKQELSQEPGEVPIPLAQIFARMKAAAKNNETEQQPRSSGSFEETRSPK